LRDAGFLRAGAVVFFAATFFAGTFLATAFFATALRAGFDVFAAFFATLAFGLALVLAVAATLRFAGFADIFADFFVFAAAFGDFFAADFAVFFFAGFAISKLSLIARCNARVLSYIPESISTTIIAVTRKSVTTLAILLLAACSRLDTLTPDLLNKAENQWNASKPGFYRLVIEMKGDRVERENFEVTVKSGAVVRLTRNGQELQPNRGQDYSMDGLFRMLHQELSLAEKPALLGAPGGYSAYPMAEFDQQTGRLIAYRRTVGGTTNTIDIRVLDFQTTQ
jgi:hypothetical protein